MKEVCRRGICGQGPLSNQSVSFPWPCEPGLEDNLLETKGRGRDGEAEHSAEGHSPGSGLQLKEVFPPNTDVS